MDPFRGHALPTPWPQTGSISFGPHDLPVVTSEPRNVGLLGGYVNYEVQGQSDMHLTSVEVAVQRLARIGINRWQMLQRSQLEYINALYLLQDADEGEVDKALTAFQSTEHARSTFPDRTSARVPSGVPSLLSDQSSQRGSVATDFSVPLDDGTGGVSAYV
ncbi:hypothetical protein CLCR_09218 [Cladophialophora carrionii]|uniref:Uncharacterized protein n=1 Tax=Cladophialophora carrionii TaxID=86049 RepID=A0A1C1CSQ2_9EURO|nr:hypothetical protein CLCR_09218 [Cladophialophora carrionii]